MSGADGSRFVAVARTSELPDGGFLRVMVDGHALVLARDQDHVYAFQRTCPHEKADLALGRIEAGRLVCPRHLASFDLTDGTAGRGWTLDPLRLYPVRVEGDDITIDAEAVRQRPPGGERKVWDFTVR
jgi:3-phenylpropionate/trans-cinnamate dioxygenase ferredoxin component